jgi:hypothetical protein
MDVYDEDLRAWKTVSPPQWYYADSQTAVAGTHSVCDPELYQFDPNALEAIVHNDGGKVAVRTMRRLTPTTAVIHGASTETVISLPSPTVFALLLSPFGKGLGEHDMVMVRVKGVPIRGEEVMGVRVLTSYTHMRVFYKTHAVEVCDGVVIASRPVPPEFLTALNRNDRGWCALAVFSERHCASVWDGGDLPPWTMKYDALASFIEYGIDFDSNGAVYDVVIDGNKATGRNGPVRIPPTFAVYSAAKDWRKTVAITPRGPVLALPSGAVYVPEWSLRWTWIIAVCSGC